VGDPQSTDRIFGPSCNESDFLLAAGQRLRDLGAGRVDGDLLAGAELHRDSARGALAELAAHGMTAHVTISDFFDVDVATMAAALNEVGLRSVSDAPGRGLRIAGGALARGCRWGRAHHVAPPRLTLLP
jgi:hypothetical protein